MFEGLDDIDWKGFGDCHIAIGFKTFEIPDTIRNLNHDDPEEREYAIACLLGEGQHLGMLDDATPQIIPFILEVLADETYRERGYIMFGLSLICSNLFNYESVAYMRLAIKTFDALKQGFPLYKRLLHDEEKETRLYTVGVMGTMQDHAIESLDLLLERLKVETDTEVRQEIIIQMIKLIYNALSPYTGEGIQTIRQMYVCLKEHGTIEENQVFVASLKKVYFSHDKEINAFMEQFSKQTEGK